MDMKYESKNILNRTNLKENELRRTKTNYIAYCPEVTPKPIIAVCTTPLSLQSLNFNLLQCL